MNEDVLPRLPYETKSFGFVYFNGPHTFRDLTCDLRRGSPGSLLNSAPRRSPKHLYAFGDLRALLALPDPDFNARTLSHTPVP